jgi:PAS domain S-box-containing protein
MKSSTTSGQRIKRFMSSRREEVIEKQYYEIKALESKYQRLYDDSPVMCRTINTEGIILDCNQSYIDNLRYASKSEVIGHTIFEHTPEDKMALKRESFEEWRKTGTVRNKEVWMKRKDGTTFPAMINASNLYGANGVLVGSNTVITDLTDNYKARMELEKSNEMRQDFVRIAAHELRTPIQPILMCAEAARRGMVSQTEALDIIVTDARRLKKLADNILDVSRIEGGRLSFEFVNLGINEIINEVVTSAQSLVANQSKMSGSKTVEIGANLTQDVQLSLDRMRIVQALSNIVTNSLKFTKEGRISLETEIISSKKMVEIRISDTGIGISQNILPRLFEKFVTESSTGSSNKHGTGLGLFITKSIILAHGGEISATNNTREGNVVSGATFVIRLPYIAVL